MQLKPPAEPVVSITNKSRRERYEVRDDVALDLMIDTMHSPPAEGAFKS